EQCRRKNRPPPPSLAKNSTAAPNPPAHAGSPIEKQRSAQTPCTAADGRPASSACSVPRFARRKKQPQSPPRQSASAPRACRGSSPALGKPAQPPAECPAPPTPSTMTGTIASCESCSERNLLS